MRDLPGQRMLEFDASDTVKEQQRREHCQRLLAGLGQPPSTISTANQFDYDRASREHLERSKAAMEPSGNA